MESIPAAEVAKAVLEDIGNGKIPNIGKIALKKGYTKATSLNPQQIKKAKSYQKVMREGLPTVIESLELEREEILRRLKTTRNKAKYRDLMDGLDKTTKLHQLLTGGKTENIGIETLGNKINKLIEDVKNADA